MIVSAWRVSLAALVQASNAAAASGFAAPGCHTRGPAAEAPPADIPSQVSTGLLIVAFFSLQMVRRVLEARVNLNGQHG